MCKKAEVADRLVAAKEIIATHCVYSEKDQKEITSVVKNGYTKFMGISQYDGKWVMTLQREGDSFSDSFTVDLEEKPHCPLKKPTVEDKRSAEEKRLASLMKEKKFDALFDTLKRGEFDRELNYHGVGDDPKIKKLFSILDDAQKGVSASIDKKAYKAFICKLISRSFVWEEKDKFQSKTDQAIKKSAIMKEFIKQSGNIIDSIARASKLDFEDDCIMDLLMKD